VNIGEMTAKFARTVLPVNFHGRMITMAEWKKLRAEFREEDT
jgi:hypothetical protein